MIEEKLIEKGISKGELESFARKRVHNGKEDVFRQLTSVARLGNLKRYYENNFLFSLGEILDEEGTRLYSYRNGAFQKLANEMLTTIKNNSNGEYENVGLNKIYKDTIKRLKEKNEQRK